MARGRGRPRKRRPPQYSLGKACSLPGPLWELWLKHVLASGPTWLYVSLLLTHVLCCRITEILKLKRKDINFKRGTVFVAPLKKGPAVTKYVMKAAMSKLRSLRDRGVAKVRSRKKGMWGMVKETDRWKFPVEQDDFLFPASRSDCHTKHTNKNTVCKAIARIRDSFDPPKVPVRTQSIRSHSGRQRMVNDMKRCGVADGTAMHFARIVDRRTGDSEKQSTETCCTTDAVVMCLGGLTTNLSRTFLGYGALDDVQTGQILGSNVKLSKTMNEIYGPPMKKKKG